MGDVVLKPFRGYARKQDSVYCIEGDRVNMEQIAARLGITKAAAAARLAKAKMKPGPVTWKRLGR